jgi:hypothetical protein
MNFVVRRSTSGASLAEASAGIILIIPLLFILLDVTTLVLAQTQNDAIAKHSARAAAAMATRASRQTTAGIVVSNYQGNAISTAPTLQSYIENPPGQNVTVVTRIVCHLPVPVPFGGPSEQSFSATGTEPIVGLLAVNTEPVAVVAATSGGGGWGQNNDKGYLQVALPCGPDGGGTPIVTAPIIGAELAGGGFRRGGGVGGGGGGGRNIKPF